MSLSEVNLGSSSFSIHKQSRNNVKSMTVNQSTNVMGSKNKPYTYQAHHVLLAKLALDCRDHS